MFELSDKPRIFAVPPGVDFADALVAGLTDRLQGQPPEALARVVIYVNTSRMQRRLRAVFDAGPARLLPQIRLITDLADLPAATAQGQMLPAAVSPLQRRLELAQFVSRLIAAQPDLAPRSALYPLADSLARLMDEMQGEAVHPDQIAALDVTDQSGHWARALAFLQIITGYFDENDGATPPDPQARQRRAVAALSRRWAQNPPRDPVIVAGSTGSRGATRAFMQAVARLPQGALILPGFDFDLPQDVWQSMQDPRTAEDHPQYRFRRLMDELGFAGPDVTAWSPRTPAAPERNALISLSLRPAPVTDQWRSEGPALPDLARATAGITLVEADSPRAEAEAIALRLRQAAATGQTAALISPDRGLTRQVTAALDRWGITPDDSAGIPLAQSPPGRFLRHIAEAMGQPISTAALLVILKHPLCHSGAPERGGHLRLTRELELHLRKSARPDISAADIAAWAAAGAERADWAAWLAALIARLTVDVSDDLGARLARHLALAAGFCAGPGAAGDDSGALWAAAAGREAGATCARLQEAAAAGGTLTAADYRALFAAVIAEASVRERDTGHPGILIWGTLEARVQGVDLAILGGLNESIWPETPAPDPWLNRAMRLQAGLLLPERQIGLSAHDYQQAVAGKSVWITRAKRSADAETVPSRWINRLTNLLSGLPDHGGKAALEAMRARGDRWLAKAAALGQPAGSAPAAPRPAPCPPAESRPKRLSVTQIKTLIRDPYAIYAEKVLRLAPLPALHPSASPALRGTILHRVLERFIRAGHGPEDAEALRDLAEAELTAACPWPLARAQWMAGFEQAIAPFLRGEAARRRLSETHRVELSGKLAVGDADVTLVGKADRIDLAADGSALIYDYKTGGIPSAKEQMFFDKQLLLEAAMLERGGFAALGARAVQAASFIAVKAAGKDVSAPLEDAAPDQVWADFIALVTAWADPAQGYTARRAHLKRDDKGPYDHLARFGEWDESMPAVPEVLT